MSLKPRTNELADAIRPTLTAKGDTIVPSDDIFEKTLPEGVTLDLVKKVDEHKQAFAAGYAYAAGELGVQMFKDAPDLEVITSEVKLGHDTFGIVQKRQTEHNAAPGSTEKVQTFGTMTTNLVTGGHGELKKVRKTIQEMAKAALGG